VYIRLYVDQCDFSYSEWYVLDFEGGSSTEIDIQTNAEPRTTWITELTALLDLHITGYLLLLSAEPA